MSDETRVALLGTGRMGAAMVGTLRRAGFDVVVWNRTRAKADAVAAQTGARSAPTPAAAVSAADVVISSLADDASVKEVFTGPDGAATALRPGSIVLEMSTIAPQTIHAIRPAIEAAGASLLDAPVSGSVSFVEHSPSTVMALNVSRADASSALRSTAGETCASVVNSAIIVAMLGSIIPAPFAIPPTVNDP